MLTTPSPLTSPHAIFVVVVVVLLVVVLLVVVDG